MKILFIGGTGIISSACSQLAIDKGMDLFLLNRGNSLRQPPQGARVIKGDINDALSLRKILEDHTFDVVVDWIAFNTEHVRRDIELFNGRTRQYIFISSASIYHTPPLNLPVVESNLLYNPFWQYSRDKIACEEMLIDAYRNLGFPVTIVRPSHTYDKTALPLHGGWTNIARMRQGKEVIVHGDGTSLWTLTHHRDFAIGLTGLFRNIHAIGDIFHITSDEILTWNQIYDILAEAAGTKAQKIHIPSDIIAQFDKDWGDGLLGDKAHSMIFDNSKIKKAVPEFNCVIPFAQGAREIIDWYDSNPTRQLINDNTNLLIDRIVNIYKDMQSKIPAKN